MRKRERVERAIDHREVDRPPFSFWTHYPALDLDPAALAVHTAAAAQELDLDFVKAMPNGMFCTEDWGVVADHSDVALGGVSRIVRPAVRVPEDWRAIRRLDVTEGAFGRELRHFADLAARLGPDIPVLATAFSPLTVARKLAGDALEPHLAQAPELVLDALAEIAATMAEFSARAIAVGCAGVFFATQQANTRDSDTASYRRFGEPFDRLVLQAAPGWFNVLHMHGTDVLFDVLKEYPVAALSWHIGETSPGIAAYRAAGGSRAILGGIRRQKLADGDLDAVRQDIRTAATESAGRGLLFGPGCVIPHPVDPAVLTAAAAEITNLAATSRLPG